MLKEEIIDVEFQIKSHKDSIPKLTKNCVEGALSDNITKKGSNNEIELK